jgi:hypothetical protein
MNLPYYSARLEGRIARSLYRAALPMIVRQTIRVARELPFNVFAYSGENTLPEQVASIRSFLTCAGRPKQFVIVSDGSYTSASIELLEKIDKTVRVQTTPSPLPPGLPNAIQSYLTTHPTGKQLALLMSLPANGPTLYTDSDVLFFPRASELAELSRTQSISALYLADYQFSGDERLIRDPSEKQNPANTGFVFFFHKLDWSRGLERLQMLSGEPNFFTNQTVMHFCMHANGAVALDPSKFVLQVDDQFIYRDRYAGPSLAIRHYVNPIRHKFWTLLAHRFPK